MTFNSVQGITIPEGLATQIKLDNNILWKVSGGYTNILPFATDTDRKTVYQGKGYITGYRLSSSGNLSQATGMCASGFIFPVKEGDVLRIKGIKPKASTASYVISYNNSNTKVAHKGFLQETDGSSWVSNNIATYDKTNDILTIILSSTNFGTGWDSIRFSAGTIDGNTIVTINEKIV